MDMSYEDKLLRHQQLKDIVARFFGALLVLIALGVSVLVSGGIVWAVWNVVLVPTLDVDAVDTSQAIVVGGVIQVMFALYGKGSR